MKKYLISSISFLVFFSTIIVSCSTNDSAPDSSIIVLPNIVTTPATIINQTTATCGGNLLSSGNGTILSRGVCYSTTPNPTIDNSKISKPGTLGTFSCSFTGLTAATQYFVRAYASNSAGLAYGEQITFTTTTTAIALPIVTTTPAFEITETAAVSGGEVTSIGGAALTARGICWATTANPSTSNNVINDSALTLGAFTSALIDLNPGTVYYIRAFATNSGGTGYGSQITFTTNGINTTSLPIVTTTEATSIMQTAATSGGSVTSDGGAMITDRGICWATTENPTILNNTIPSSGTTGTFTSLLSGLTANTMYHVRAYATNSVGTAYGLQIMFMTPDESNAGPTGGNAVCDGTQPTTLVTVTSSTGKIWMDRNLGASRAATARNDFSAYGCLYQWGRGNDGHASINWVRSSELSPSEPAGTPVNGSTLTLSTTDTPGNALFIADATTYGDWRSPSNSNLWQGVNGINNPCPMGYRVPTRTELRAEYLAYSITNATTAYTSIHKFVLAGTRNQASAIVGSQGQTGFYWTSISSGTMAEDISYDLTATYTNSGSNNKTNGFSVRCIKN